MLEHSKHATTQRSHQLQKLSHQQILPFLPEHHNHHHPRCHGTQSRFYYPRHLRTGTHDTLARSHIQNDFKQVDRHCHSHMSSTRTHPCLPSSLRRILHLQDPEQQLLDVQKDALKPYPLVRHKQGKNN